MVDTLAYFRQSDLKKYSEQILPAIKNNHFYEWQYVYFSSKQQKEFEYLGKELEINDNTSIGDKARILCIKTKLGDKTALDDMIRELKSTKNFRFKEYLVKYLGLIGNKKCIIALLEALSDNQQLNKGYTLRYLILPAIWRNYPDDKLFVEYCPWLRMGDKYIGGKAGVKILYSKICKWAKKKLNVNLDLSKAEPIILNPYANVRKRYKK